MLLLVWSRRGIAPSTRQVEATEVEDSDTASGDADRLLGKPASRRNQENEVQSEEGPTSMYPSPQPEVCMRDNPTAKAQAFKTNPALSVRGYLLLQMGVFF